LPLNVKVLSVTIILEIPNSLRFLINKLVTTVI